MQSNKQKVLETAEAKRWLEGLPSTKWEPKSRLGHDVLSYLQSSFVGSMITDTTAELTPAGRAQHQTTMDFSLRAFDAWKNVAQRIIVGSERHVVCSLAQRLNDDALGRISKGLSDSLKTRKRARGEKSNLVEPGGEVKDESSDEDIFADVGDYDPSAEVIKLGEEKDDNLLSGMFRSEAAVQSKVHSETALGSIDFVHDLEEEKEAMQVQLTQRLQGLSSMKGSEEYFDDDGSDGNERGKNRRRRRRRQTDDDDDEY